MIELTKNMSGSISEELQKIGLTEQITDLTDAHVEELWALLADIPCNWAENGSDLVPIPDVLESTTKPCLDEDFFIWKRGTIQQEVWEWFDKHHSKGVAYLMHNNPASHIKKHAESIAVLPPYCDVTISIVPPGAVEADLRDQPYNYADDLEALLASLAEKIGIFSLTFKDDVGGWMTLRLDQTKREAAEEWSHSHTEITGFDIEQK